MEEMKNKIDNQIEILKQMISENKEKEKIREQKDLLDKLLEEYIKDLEK